MSDYVRGGAIATCYLLRGKKRFTVVIIVMLCSQLPTAYY